MKRKFITVENSHKKRKAYLDDLNQIYQTTAKNLPKIPKFREIHKNFKQHQQPQLPNNFQNQKDDPSLKQDQSSAEHTDHEQGKKIDSEHF